MQETIRVFFDVMRHGEKDGDFLTELGIRQVMASAKTNLAGHRYLMVFFSGMVRAERTARVILSKLEMNGSLSPRWEPGFGYNWCDDRAGFPMAAAEEQINRLVASGAQETAALWMYCWPPTRSIRGRLIGTLEKWTLYAAMRASEGGSPVGDGVRFLVASHSPTAELACLDPSTTPKLGLADGITYEMEVNLKTLEMTLVSSEVWRCPDGVE